MTANFIAETAVARSGSQAPDDLKPYRLKDKAGFRIDLVFFLDFVLMKRSKTRQITRLPKSVRSMDRPPGASASMVAAKLERIRIIVIRRRDRRSAVCNEIWVVIDMDIP
jgi:hypothetical protein